MLRVIQDGQAVEPFTSRSIPLRGEWYGERRGVPPERSLPEWHIVPMGIRWVGVAIDCEWAGRVARFYEGLLGFEIRDLGPGDRWAQLFNPKGGVHLNIQGDASYEPPVSPEQPGELAKMLHFEVQVDDLDEAVALALELGGSQAPWQPPDRNPTRLRVMLDPAGHPICLFLEGE